MILITLDFETYYDKEYSLSKLTTEEYIRDERFEVIGVSVKVGDGDTQWFSGTWAETFKFLHTFDWQDAMLIAHNARFDAAILSWHFDIHPKAIADTMAMARALHGIEVGHSLAALVQFHALGEKGTEVNNALGKRRLDFSPEERAQYGRYCVNDTELTYKLFNVLAQTFPKDEFKLVDLTIKMFTEPVLTLDALLLEQHLNNIRERKHALMVKVAGGEPYWSEEDVAKNMDVYKKSIMSNDKFAALLSGYGVVPPMKTSPTTGKQTYAFAKTDPGLQELAEHPNEEVQALVAARLGIKSTIEETRTLRFMGIAQRGNLPIPLKTFAAHTSRWGGDDKINLQNLSSRGKDAGKLKHAIRAPKGYVIIDSDSSQIEARMLAWLSGQKDLVEIFENNNAEIRAGVPKDDHKYDPYKIMAAQIYNKPSNKVTGPERFIGKTVILGSGYGLGGKKFHMFMRQAGVDMSEDMASHIITTYRNVYPAIPALWEQGNQCLNALIEGRSAPYGVGEVVTLGWGMVFTPLGIPLRYHNLRRTQNAKGQDQIIYTSRTGVTDIWGGKFTENIIQHLARVVIGQQMLRIAKRYRVVLTVHDAIACIAPVKEAEEARAFVEEQMRWVPPWAAGLPLNCESGMGSTYGEC